MDDYQHAQHEGRKDQDVRAANGGVIDLTAQLPEEQSQAGGAGEGPQEQPVKQGADGQ
jgi:hypothetical protein